MSGSTATPLSSKRSNLFPTNPQKNVEKNPEYQQLEQAYNQADAAAKPRRDELQKHITDLSAQILAVQNVFTDKRAYANAITYEIETDTSHVRQAEQKAGLGGLQEEGLDRRISRRS